MSGHHHHDHSGPIAIGATAARVVVGLLTGIGVLVVIGAICLWPSHQHINIPLPMQNGGGGAVQTEAGSVIMQDIGPCGSPSNGKVFDDTPEPPPGNSYTCARSLVSIDSGPAKGHHTLLEIPPGPGQPTLKQGDHIRILRQNDPSGQPTYSFEDYARGFPLTLVVLIFVLVVVVVARWRGLRAVIGLVFAFVVLVMFMLPALLDGKPALPVAVVSGAIILYAVLYLAHGVNLRTSSALLGTLSAMVLATVLSWVALKLTHVTGLSQEDNTNVATYVQHVSITGLLLAGFIIGSLGVLNDVTITQASAAFELAEIDKKATRREVFAAAMRVGRDHIASTVYTLVLAYAGGALPLLLMFSVAGRSLGDVITGDSVAIEIVRSAVGGICLALSVPLTTVIAVLLARPFSLGSEPEPEPGPRRTRDAKAVAGARQSRRPEGTRPRQRPGRPQRRPEPESESDPGDTADENYLRSLSGPDQRPGRRRPESDSPSGALAASDPSGAPAPPRRRRAPADRRPGEPHSSEGPVAPRAPGRTTANPYPGPYEQPPGHRTPGTQSPPGRPPRLSAEPHPTGNDYPAHNTGPNVTPDWFADTPDPYQSPRPPDDYPRQPRPQRFPGPAGNPGTAGRRYRRNPAPEDYDA